MVASLSPAVAAALVPIAFALTANGTTGVMAFSAGIETGVGGAIATCTVGVSTRCTTRSVGTGGGGTTAGGGCTIVACSESGIGTCTGNRAIGRSANNRITRFKLRVSAIASERAACGAHSNERETAIDVISHLLAVRNVARGAAAQRPGRTSRYAFGVSRTSAGANNVLC